VTRTISIILFQKDKFYGITIKTIEDFRLRMSMPIAVLQQNRKSSRKVK